MKSNDLQSALAMFLKENPDLPEGEVKDEVTDEPKNQPSIIRLHVTVEKKGRKGKTATIIDGLSAIGEEQAQELAKDLKMKLGAGGSYRGDEILIQGNLRDKVVGLLKEKGFQVK